MIAEHVIGLMLATFLAGYLIGDVARRAVEAEKRRQRRRTLRDVERAWRSSRPTSSRSPW